jgi:hypothetical protein
VTGQAKLVKDTKPGERGAGNTSTSYHTDKKEYKIFLIYKEIQSGAVASPI